MIGPRNVHPDELGDAEGMDVQDSIRVGNRLLEAMDDVAMTLGDDFDDRVMAALADEPTPGTTGFLVPLRRRGVLAGLGESVRQAWASAGTGRPMLGRSAALAYVLAIVVAGISLTGAVTIGGAGALGLFNAAPSTSPVPTAPQPTIAPPSIAPPVSQPAPTVGPDAVEPTPSPTASDDEPEASDDHGGNSGPGGGGDDDSGRGADDGSDSGSGGNSGPGSSGSGSGGSGSGGSRSGGSSGTSGPGPGSDDSGS